MAGLTLAKRRPSEESGGRRVFEWTHWLVVLAASVWLWTFDAAAQTNTPYGVWLMDGRVAVETFDCDGLLCGRIVWLAVPRDAQGVLDRDKNNPDPALRERPLCGLTIIWNLHPVGADRWRSGWFYNPDDGKTYRVSARLLSNDAFRARIFVGLPIFGEDRSFVRVPHGASEGWC